MDALNRPIEAKTDEADGRTRTGDPFIRAFAGPETWGASRAWTDIKYLLSGALWGTGA
jgi:hypothetical protein